MADSPVAVRRSDPMVKALLAATFPDYKGRKVRVARFDKPLYLDLSWSGGTKDSVVLVDVANGRIGRLVVPSPWARGAHDPVDAPAGSILAVHSYFMGSDAGVTFYVSPPKAGALDSGALAGLLGSGA